MFVLGACTAPFTMKNKHPSIFSLCERPDMPSCPMQMNKYLVWDHTRRLQQSWDMKQLYPVLENVAGPLWLPGLSDMAAR